jgi:hypothetical protein
MCRIIVSRTNLTTQRHGKTRVSSASTRRILPQQCTPHEQAIGEWEGGGGEENSHQDLVCYCCVCLRPACSPNIPALVKIDTRPSQDTLGEPAHFLRAGPPSTQEMPPWRREKVPKAILELSPSVVRGHSSGTAIQPFAKPLALPRG